MSTDGPVAGANSGDASGRPPTGRRIGFPTAVAVVGCVFLLAAAAQNVWGNASRLFRQMPVGGDRLPLAILCGVAAVVALAMVVLLLRRLKRLLLSQRVRVAALAATAAVVLAGTIFEAEGMEAPRGPAAWANDRRAAELLGQKAGAKAMVVARTARLTDGGRSWPLLALLGFLGLGSAAALLWARPVGPREFGFMAAHSGVLLTMAGLCAGALLGMPGGRLLVRPGEPPVPVPAGPSRKAPFTVAASALKVERAPAGVEVWALAQPGAAPERLTLDEAHPGPLLWRGLEVTLRDYRRSAAAEDCWEEASDEVRNPALLVELADGTGHVARGLLRQGVPAALGLSRTEVYYVRAANADAAEAARRAEAPQRPEHLLALAEDGRQIAAAELPPDDRKPGHEFVLEALGLRLRIVRFLPRARPASPPGAGFEAAGESEVAAMPALELAPVQGGPGGAAGEPFWVAGTGGPLQPLGPMPPALNQLLLAYLPARSSAFGVRVVEWPAGRFQAVEIDRDRPARVVPETAAAGGELPLSAGRRLRLLRFFGDARRGYRPAEAGRGGALGPAVLLAIRPPAAERTDEFWLLPELSGARRAFGATFWARLSRGGPRRVTVELELRDRDGRVRKRTAGFNRPVRHRGWQLTLVSWLDSGDPAAAVPGTAVLSVRRDPQRYLVFAGMALLAVGVPALLWSRLRRVPEREAGED